MHLQHHQPILPAATDAAPGVMDAQLCQTPPPQPGGERRRDPRVVVDRVVRVRVPMTGRFMVGHTVDVGPRGALVRLGRTERLAAGQRVRVGLADGPGQPISSHDMLSGTVIRSGLTQGHAEVAVRFDYAAPRALTRSAA